MYIYIYIYMHIDSPLGARISIYLVVGTAAAANAAARGCQSADGVIARATDCTKLELVLVFLSAHTLQSFASWLVQNWRHVLRFISQMVIEDRNAILITPRLATVRVTLPPKHGPPCHIDLHDTSREQLGGHTSGAAKRCAP